MKLKTIAAACAIAFAGISGQAMAAAVPAGIQTDLNDANTNGRVIYISGASAVQAGFDAIISQLFTGTVTYFTNGGTTPADITKANYIGALGTLATGNGPWSGSKAIVIYRVTGGSAFGVFPVAENTAIDALTVTSAACDDASGTRTGTTTSAYNCTVAANSRVPDAGVSDVAPSMFIYPYNTEGETPHVSVSAADLAAFNSPGKIDQIYGLAFGVPVTNNVGLVNLNRSALAAIMTGNVGTWDQVDSSLPADDIVICRRTPGSGTQAVNNMYFGNFPCNSAFNVPADRDSGSAWNATTKTFTHTANTGALDVIENASSGDVRTCLDKAVTGGSYTTKDRDGNPVTVTFAAGTKAIGVLSMDSLSSSKTTGAGGNWQFRSLEGAGTYTWDNTAAAPVSSGTGKFPTLASITNGDWDFIGMESFNVPSRTASNANKNGVVANFLVKANSPTVLAGITALKNVAAGLPGSGTGANLLRTSYLNGNQCAPYNRNN